MSLQSWKDSYYPTPASEAAVSDDVALDHSILKWMGALPENTENHEVSFTDGSIIEEPETTYLTFNDETCALCHRHYKPHENEDCCKTCPLVKSGHQQCNSFSSPYQNSVCFDDPQPMINALLAAKAYTNSHS